MERRSLAAILLWPSLRVPPRVRYRRARRVWDKASDYWEGT
jgi:hypothetical protein